jgi:hypothetical protein
MPSLLGDRSQNDTESPKIEPIRGTGLLGKGKEARYFCQTDPLGVMKSSIKLRSCSGFTKRVLVASCCKHEIFKSQKSEIRVPDNAQTLETVVANTEDF